jgi:hypothetical protein
MLMRSLGHKTMFSTKGYIDEGTLTREYLFSLVSEYAVFKHYIASFKNIKSTFRSELRKDKYPSCKILKTNLDGLIYIDFSTGEKYSCTSYVAEKYGISYKKALRVIANDFNISTGIKEDLVERKKVADTNIQEASYAPSEIRITSIQFSKNGLIYWQQYGIDEKLLNLYQVKQLSHFRINGRQVKLNKEIAFAYCFDKYRYKILRPSQPKGKKWRNNCTPNVIQGFKQLPDTGKLLIITKALKDVMVLRALGYNAVAPQSENTYIPDKAMAWLKQRWDKILIYFDNDEPGINAAKKFSKLHNIPYIYNPLEVEEKDISDYYKEYGKEKALDLISKLNEQQK